VRASTQDGLRRRLADVKAEKRRVDGLLKPKAKEKAKSEAE
jgi:hypothetical protein